MTQLDDSAVKFLKEFAQELLDSRNDAEESEAIRAFLVCCQNYRISVDSTGELVNTP